MEEFVQDDGVHVATATHQPTLYQLLTSKQLSELLSVSEATLSRWRAAGTGPNWSDLNGIARYRWSDVAAFVDDHTK